jgi:hypothetical protein
MATMTPCSLVDRNRCFGTNAASNYRVEESIKPVLDRDLWRASVNTAMHLRVQQRLGTSRPDKHLLPSHERLCSVELESCL